MKLYQLFESTEKKTHHGKEDLSMTYHHFNPDSPQNVSVAHFDRPTKTFSHHAIASLLFSKSGDINWQAVIPHDPPIPESAGSRMKTFNERYRCALKYQMSGEYAEEKMDDLEDEFDDLMVELRQYFTATELFSNKTIAYYRNHMLKTLEAFQDVTKQSFYKRSGNVESHLLNSDSMASMYGQEIAKEIYAWVNDREILHRCTLFHFTDKKYDFIVTNKTDVGKIPPIVRITDHPWQQDFNELLAIPGSEDFYFDNWDDIVEVSSTLSYPINKLPKERLQKLYNGITKPNRFWPNGYEKDFKEFFLDFVFAKSFSHAHQRLYAEDAANYESFVNEVLSV